ncbi:adenosylcobinamide kinase /adenosylcobinamide-phosphate guanylyltransferase [Desulfotomaculum arcticum]|uniref:Adenosylcobinamide kinase n=1 Tax=Desulfotruncus arcticus DSM 17038 TaxID=1121424 RepID=A0A1I2S5T5_9FIRM|nr:bifunctional adenosylcobinamide kinase/adenosylcobinamide-phosphate guanylyltransferase [Desulfotruncus arcticus]SFG48264.1 adenosylcobinamide kinase /adenosylcobinamide-phosphate guanylyltransferase [Desulfotomaculum arcticum] [Desulfotruncus arcticus DSM 17038]
MAGCEIVLVIGGARSGKSAVAESYASNLANKVVYIATAGVQDEEMARRVKLHRERRPENWSTVEEKQCLGAALTKLQPGSVVLVDCLTIWITNWLLDQTVEELSAEAKETRIMQEAANFIQAAQDNKLKLIMVSNEVGYGLVPDNELGRLFRDISGRVNQYVAAVADKVFLVISGIPLEIKSLALHNAFQEGI